MFYIISLLKFIIRISYFFIVSDHQRILVTTGFIGNEGQEDGRNSEVIDVVNPNLKVLFSDSKSFDHFGIH